MGKKRQDFPQAVIRLLGERVGFVCSNPECGVATIGPADTPNKREYIGVAAHIYSAAVDNGPRPKPNLTEEERTNIANGIHLCNKCSRKIDTNNGIDYPAELLYEWKKNAEMRQRSRGYENNFIDLYRPIDYKHLEIEYSAALSCSGLGEHEVNSCPSDSFLIKEVNKNLSLANKCVIRGPSGSGKSLLTHQVAKSFHDNSTLIIQLNKSIFKSTGYLVEPTESALLIVDDAQILPENLIETLLQSANSRLLVLINWNVSSSLKADFLKSYSCVDIDPKTQVKLLTDYCLANKDSISRKLVSIGIKVTPRSFHDTIEQRIERASRENTPWAFNYSLSEGWLTAKKDLERYHNQERLDIILYIVSAYQLVTLDEGVNIQHIDNALKNYSKDKKWFKNAEHKIHEVAINVDGKIRLKHYRYAESLLKIFISTFNDDDSRDFSIRVFELLLNNNEFCNGHENILEFLMFNFHTAQHVILQGELIHELAKDSLLNEDIPIKVRIQRLRSLVRFSKKSLSSIEQNPGIIENWLLICDKDTAYPLYWLLNELGNAKYDKLEINREILVSIFDAFVHAPLTVKARFSGLFQIAAHYTHGSNLPDACQIIDSVNPIIDLSRYDSDSAHFHYAHLISDLANINEKWAEASLIKNIPTMAQRINTDTMNALQNYHELFNIYFGVISAILGSNNKYRHRKVGKKLTTLLSPDKIASTMENVNHSNIQSYWEFLLFISMHNKPLLKMISEKMDFDHLKALYKGDEELNHDHRCILSILYYGHGKNFDSYIIHLLNSLDIFHIQLFYMNPEFGLTCLKSGKKLDLKIHIGEECGQYLNLFAAFEDEGELDVVKNIIRDNKNNIRKAIYSSSTNVDRKKVKYDLLIYVFHKCPDVMKDIFTDNNEITRLLTKIKMLLKGRKMEKQIAKLYLFFLKKFAKNSHQAIEQLEKQYPSIKRFSIV